jgi:predicted transcriptional regulator
MIPRNVDTEPRAFLSEVLGANREQVNATRILRDISASSALLDDLVMDSHASEQTIRRYLTDLEARDLLQCDSSGYQLTELGEMTRKRYEIHLGNIDEKSLCYFVKNDTNFAFLLAISDGSRLQPELAEQIDISRSQIRSIASTFEETNWVRRRGSNCSLTKAGQEAIDAYEQFAIAAKQIQKFAPVLCHFGRSVTDLPVEHLATAEMIEAVPERPQNAINVAADLAGPNLTTFYGFSNTVNRDIAEAYMSAIRNDTKAELIIPEYLLPVLPKEGKYGQYVKDGLAASNFQVLLVREELPFGFGVFDNETILLAPVRSDGYTRGVIKTNDEAIIEWATDIYREYRECAWCPSRYTLRRVLPDSIVQDSLLQAEDPPFPDYIKTAE